MDYGELNVRDRGVEIRRADEVIGMSLELIRNASHQLRVVNTNQVSIGSTDAVTYEVVGWDNEAKCLILEKRWDSRDQRIQKNNSKDEK